MSSFGQTVIKTNLIKFEIVSEKTIQYVVLSVKLPKLHDYNRRRTIKISQSDVKMTGQKWGIQIWVMNTDIFFLRERLLCLYSLAYLHRTSQRNNKT